MQEIPLATSQLNTNPVQTVQPTNPLDALSKALSVANLSQQLKENQTRQQILERQANQQQQTASTISDAYNSLSSDKDYQNGDADTKYRKELDTVGGALRQKGLIQPALDFEKMLTDHYTAEKQLTSLQREELQNKLADQKAKHDQIANLYGNFSDPSAYKSQDDADAAFLDTYKRNYQKHIAAGLIDPNDPLTPSPDQVTPQNAHSTLMGILNGTDAGRSIMKGISDRLESVGKAEQSRAAAAKDTAEAAKTTAETGALPTTRADALQRLAGTFAPTGPTAASYQKYAARLAAIPQSGPVMQKVLDEASKESDQQAADARTTARELSVAAANRQAAAGNDPRLNAVPPGQHKDVLDKVQKVEDTLNSTQQAADDMKTFIDMARAGNKVAYSYAPTEGVLTFNTGRGVKRVNMAEIGSYSGAGSLADRVQGFLGKQVSGASIPPNILNDMQNLHQAVLQNAQTAHDREIKSIDKTYRSNFGGPSQDNSKQNPFR